MRSSSSPKFRQSLLYVACYALWLALSALGVLLIFQVRAAIFAVTLWLRLNPWQVHAAEQFGTVTFGLVWLVGILILENSLRQGVLKNRLWRRAARAFVVLAVALALCFIVQLVLS